MVLSTGAGCVAGQLSLSMAVCSLTRERRGVGGRAGLARPVRPVPRLQSDQLTMLPRVCHQTCVATIVEAILFGSTAASLSTMAFVCLVGQRQKNQIFKM